MITILDAMFSDVIDLWWKKIPPTHPCFILVKNRKEKAFEKRKIKLWVWNGFKKNNYLFATIKFIYLAIVFLGKQRLQAH